MGLLDSRCKHCGIHIKRAMLTSMLMDCGARTNVSPVVCPGREDEGDHEFEDTTRVEKPRPTTGKEEK
jgi:hypothetical protein